jgi:ankyrin repeat protein
VRLLLSAGATPTSLTEFGQTPAHLAAENGQYVSTVQTSALRTCARSLFFSSSPSHILNPISSPRPLLSAECLKLLLEACPELVNVKDIHGDVPLAAAKLYNHEECIRLLLNPPSPKFSKKSSSIQKAKAKAKPAEPGKEKKEKTPAAAGPKAGKSQPASSAK